MIVNYFNTDSYFDYLKRNFNIHDNSSQQDKTCTRPDLGILAKYLEMLIADHQPNANFIDIGCGLGRTLYYLKDRKLKLFGIDISAAAVKDAKTNIPSLAQQIECAASENIPFENTKFDYIAAWGVFDLTEEEKSLRQFIDRCNIDGKILLLGRNNNYMDTDDDAFEAEKAIINKNIPIKYTDYSIFKEQILASGCSIEFEHFFLQRGDLAQLKHLENQPEQFYEYIVILKKNKSLSSHQFKPFAFKNSLTWERRNAR